MIKNMLCISMMLLTLSLWAISDIQQVKEDRLTAPKQVFTSQSHMSASQQLTQPTNFNSRSPDDACTEKAVCFLICIEAIRCMFCGP